MSSQNETSSFQIDADAVNTLAKILKETDLTEIEYELESGRIRVVRASHASQRPLPNTHLVEVANQQPLQAAPPPAAVAHPATQDWTQHAGALKSPLVGTAYLSPQPDAAPFVKEGDTVADGQTLMILEAMKVMNPIRAPKSGKVLKILVENGHPVEYGETLVVIG